jgi:hypothetical protein
MCRCSTQQQIAVIPRGLGELWWMSMQKQGQLGRDVCAPVSRNADNAWAANQRSTAAQYATAMMQGSSAVLEAKGLHLSQLPQRCRSSTHHQACSPTCKATGHCKRCVPLAAAGAKHVTAGGSSVATADTDMISIVSMGLGFVCLKLPAIVQCSAVC